MVFVSRRSQEVNKPHRWVRRCTLRSEIIGYKDSSADIAYILRHKCKLSTITPNLNPVPSSDQDWCFPDTEDGILDAVTKGATHLWANTILFASHPLQSSVALASMKKPVFVVGQPPNLVELYDDKNEVNNYLRRQEGLTLPKSTIIHSENKNNLKQLLKSTNLHWPIVGKPLRGRGSHGVKVCPDERTLSHHLQDLFAESPQVMLEQYLFGEEITITVLPPSPCDENEDRYKALPVVRRFNHDNGIAPYNGVVAVTLNSRVLSEAEISADSKYEKAMRECETVAELLRATAPIRIDLRRFDDSPSSTFALFDVNMKPVCISFLDFSRLGLTMIPLFKNLIVQSSVMHFNISQYICLFFAVILSYSRKVRVLRVELRSSSLIFTFAMFREESIINSLSFSRTKRYSFFFFFLH
jgi:D-alanine-D-alanine ligase-like ATP-grasp enzyme